MRSARVMAVAASCFAATFARSLPALADVVVVLPFAGTPTDATTARQATASATVLLGHKLPAPSAIERAERTVTDGSPDTSDEYRAAGAAAAADWTLTGRVTRSAAGERIEIEGFQVATGRLESLSRLVTDTERVNQLKELLALLVRPEGVANADPAWLHALPSPPAPAASAAPPNDTAPIAPPPPQRERYAHLPIVVSALGGVNAAASRPSGATGSSVAIPIGLALGYAPEALEGIELRAQGTGHVSGPGVVTLDAGARYLLPVSRAPLFIGGEAAIGGFFATGVAKDARFLLRGTAVVAYALGERFQIEGALDVDAAFGGVGSLVLLGGHAACGVRF